MHGHILIVEDEQRLATLLGEYLQQAGFSISWLKSGKEVASQVRKHAPQMVLLDLMLPDKDGLTICREIRQFSQLPIIMITARVEEIDRLLGLELGADDYICKPFSPREVVARVKAVLRRGGQTKTQEEIPRLQLDQTTYTALLAGQQLDLTAVEFRLLSTLAAQPGRIFSRDQLMRHIYRDQHIVCDRTIDSHIKKLRKKIMDVSPGLELIYSVYGVGYKLEY